MSPRLGVCCEAKGYMASIRINGKQIKGPVRINMADAINDRIILMGAKNGTPGFDKLLEQLIIEKQSKNRKITNRRKAIESGPSSVLMKSIHKRCDDTMSVSSGSTRDAFSSSASNVSESPSLRSLRKSLSPARGLGAIGISTPVTQHTESPVNDFFVGDLQPSDYVDVTDSDFAVFDQEIAKISSSDNESSPASDENKATVAVNNSPRSMTFANLYYGITQQV